MTEGRDAERDCGITIKPTLVLGDWGEKWRERPLFFSSGSWLFFCVFFRYLENLRALNSRHIDVHDATILGQPPFVSWILFFSVNSCMSVVCFTESLQDFKSEVHKLFPLIYDTKFLAFEIRKNPVSKLAEEQYIVWEYWQVRERGQKPQRIEESGGLPLLSSLPQRLLPDVTSKSSKRADIRKRF